jgi:hypothetical protein
VGDWDVGVGWYSFMPCVLGGWIFERRIVVSQSWVSREHEAFGFGYLMWWMSC